MSDCVFCMIANHEIPSNIAYEDDKIIAFHDLDPQAPVHVLVIPKKHIASLDATTDEDQELLGYLLCKIKDIAKDLGLENGYRVVSNNGDDAFQASAFPCDRQAADGLAAVPETSVSAARKKI